MNHRLIVLLLVCCAAQTASAQGTPELPSGFAVSPLAFMDFPSSLAILPDGRILITELDQALIKVYAQGNTATIGTVPNVDGAPLQRGLTGIAVDPQWPARPYIYLVFDAINPAGIRVSMFEVTGDLTDPAGTNLALGAEYIIIDGVPSLSPIHNGGAARFGPDGMLYVSFGDDENSCEPQNLNSLLGKLIRLDVSSLPGVGIGPPHPSQIAAAGNPFAGPLPNGPIVWSYGLRNPFRFHIDSLTGHIYIGDVGASGWEEVNISTTGGENFGWPFFEGSAPYFLPCPGTPPSTVAPAYEVDHLDGYSAVISLGVYRNDPAAEFAFGEEYDGSYFFADWTYGKILRLEATGGILRPATPGLGQFDPVLWCNNAPLITDAVMGPDGAIYFTKVGPGLVGCFRATNVALTGTPAPGNTFSLSINDPLEAGNIYVCGLAFEHSPGTLLSNGTGIPLNFDDLLALSLVAGNPLIGGNIGIVDPTGYAESQVTIPAIPALTGFEISAAYIIYNPALMIPEAVVSVTRPRRITIQ